ncbi:MAG TPA: hypothetical protein VJ732_12875 [Bryobacteraceae bacterium]|nr:hypothetical protein [Bryobacteraceae bacterium]
MLIRGLLVICALALPTILLGDMLDPGIIIDSGDPGPIPITSGINNVGPTGATPVTFDFINNTSLIIQFEFQTTINPGLTQQQISDNFSCTNPANYFQKCSIGYDSSNGNLTYTFFDTLPADADETGTDTEIDEFEGIPTNGLFHITLDGWTSDATGTGGVQLYSGLPEFTNSFETAVPEPSAAFLLITGVAVLCSRRWYLGRRRAARPA